MQVIIEFKVKAEISQVVRGLPCFSELFLMFANEFNKVKLLRLYWRSVQKIIQIISSLSDLKI